jgi:hypothetical protein
MAENNDVDAYYNDEDIKTADSDLDLSFLDEEEQD